MCNKKYRSVEEMEPIPVPTDPDKIADRIAFVWQMANAICPLKWPPGIRKYRSIEEANLDREAHNMARARATRKS